MYIRIIVIVIEDRNKHQNCLVGWKKRQVAQQNSLAVNAKLFSWFGKKPSYTG